MWIAKDCAEKNQIHRAIREAKYLRPAGMQLMVTSRFLAVLAVLVAWRQVSHWRQEFEKAQAQRDAFRRFGQPGRWFPMGDETQRGKGGKGGKGNFINHQSSKMDGRFTMVYHGLPSPNGRFMALPTLGICYCHFLATIATFLHHNACCVQVEDIGRPFIQHQHIV